MGQNVLILVAISIMIIAISMVIIRSKSMQQHDKLISLLLLITLFAVINIVNELKLIWNNKNGFATINTSQLYKQFYDQTQYQQSYIQYPLDPHNQLLRTNQLDYQQIKQSIIDIKYQKHFKLYFGAKGVGKSDLFQYLVHRLRKDKLPAWYFSVHKQTATVNQFIRSNRFSNHLVLDQTVEKFNRNNVAPLIILDNSEYLVDELDCEVCQLVADLFDDRVVNIIMVSDLSAVLGLFRQNEYLIRRLEMLKFVGPTSEQIMQIAHRNTNENSKIDECTQIRLDDLNGLIKQSEQTIAEYCIELKKQRVEIVSDQEQQLVRDIDRLMQENGGVVQYGQMKQVYKNSVVLNRLIDQAISNNLIYVQNGYYHFYDNQLVQIILNLKS